MFRDLFVYNEHWNSCFSTFVKDLFADKLRSIYTFYVNVLVYLYGVMGLYENAGLVNKVIAYNGGITVG